MKTRIFNIAACLILFVALSGCSGRGRHVALSGGEIYAPKYAVGFSVYGTDGESTVIEIRNPWQGAENVTSQLFVSRNGELPPEGFAGETVKAPVGRVVCFSSTHVAFMDALGAADRVKGVSGADYISCPVVAEGYARGDVRDIGYDANINYEVLASLRPDVVFLYGVAGENTSVTDKLRELHIPYVYIGEYLEEDPLGKSEWVVAFGELLDNRGTAEEIFTGIAGRYDALKAEASGFTKRPKVMLNAPYRDVWFVPGDRSYMVKLVRDAGGDYIFAGDDSAVSRPLSGEAAYVAAKSADVWLNPNQATSIAELKAQNPKFTGIRCVDERRVYNATKRLTPAGGSDFWESGALNADVVLRDMMMCLHPEWVGSASVCCKDDAQCREAAGGCKTGGDSCTVCLKGANKAAASGADSGIDTEMFYFMRLE